MTGFSVTDALRDVERAFTDLEEGERDAFDRLAGVVYDVQRRANPIYSRYCKAVSSDAAPKKPPYLPIAAFKRAAVTTFPPDTAEHVFESSGTGQGIPSRHYVKDLRLYDRSIEEHFRRVFGPQEVYLATHLPHYAAMGARSSLLYMVDRLRRQFGLPGSGSFLEDRGKLDELVELSLRNDRQLIVFGAAFGLMDFIESHPRPLPPGSLVIETGGMKTYRREIDRQPLHASLAEGFSIDRSRIRSEYGMCELMSQCYTRGGPVFYPPPWMRFEVVRSDDPFRPAEKGEPGVLGIFDLANMHTVSAILTEDRAVQRGDGFEVLGRLDGAELRGCNFLLENV